MLAVGGYRNSYRAASLWDLTDPAHPTRTAYLRPHPTHPFAGSAPTVHALAFSPDRRLLATASEHDYTVSAGTTFAVSPGMHDSVVIVWDITDPTRPRHTLTLPHPDGVTAVAFSPDGTILASGAADHTVRLWKIR